VFEHGEMAKEKPDKTEQDGETQIVPKERVPKCPNSRRCMLGTYVLSELHKKRMLTEPMWDERKLSGHHQDDSQMIKRPGTKFEK
jgi:hypothetical protein